MVGAGPAGLAAAARILERGRDRAHVRIATLGHHIGGKASSWRDADGRLIDHGQHVIVGFYREMRALVRRAGVDVEAHLVTNEGHSYVFEERDGLVHDISLARNPLGVLYKTMGFPGLSSREKRSIFRFTMANLGLFLGAQSIDELDDVCFTAFCLEGGLAPSIVRTNAFKMSRFAQLNWPGEISAYSMLKAMREMSRDYRMSEYSFCDGGMTERFWEPILAYVASMGAELELMRKLTGLRARRGRLTGVTFAEPDSGGHDLQDRHPGLSVFAGPVPVKAGTEVVDTAFDQVICTLPATSFQELNPGDRVFWSIPAFRRIRQLRGVKPLAMQIWHRERVTRRYESVIAGLQGPLAFVIDSKHVIREYRENPRYGAVLYLVGQETGYEGWTDGELLELTLKNLSRLPGYERMRSNGILHWKVIRHHAPHELYWYTEPGAQRLRPFHRTPVANLKLAGDWVRSELDFPCMEAAIRSGQEAADAVLEDVE